MFVPFPFLFLESIFDYRRTTGVEQVLRTAEATSVSWKRKNPKGGARAYLLQLKNQRKEEEIKEQRKV